MSNNIPYHCTVEMSISNILNFCNLLKDNGYLYTTPFSEFEYSTLLNQKSKKRIFIQIVKKRAKISFKDEFFGIDLSFENIVKKVGTWLDLKMIQETDSFYYQSFDNREGHIKLHIKLSMLGLVVDTTNFVECSEAVYNTVYYLRNKQNKNVLYCYSSSEINREILVEKEEINERYLFIDKITISLRQRFLNKLKPCLT